MKLKIHIDKHQITTPSPNSYLVEGLLKILSLGKIFAATNDYTELVSRKGMDNVRSKIPLFQALDSNNHVIL